MFPHLKVKEMGLFALLLTYRITAKPYGLNQASSMPAPRQPLWGAQGLIPGNWL